MRQKQKIELLFFTDRRRVDAFDNVVVKVHLQKQKNNQKVFLIGGTDPKVGASSVAKHIAAGLAKSGRKTVLLDGDMRKTGEEKYQREICSHGLDQYLSNDIELDEILYPTNVDMLDIIPSDRSEDSVQLLCSKKMEELFRILRENYEYIIVDIPSFGAVSDGSAVLANVDQVILVAAPGRSYKKQILECYDTIKKYGTETLGIVVNRVDKYGYHDYRKNAQYYEKSTEGLKKNEKKRKAKRRKK